jgi:PhoD-like phosphatase, N-terminal domain
MSSTLRFCKFVVFMTIILILFQTVFRITKENIHNGMVRHLNKLSNSNNKILWLHRLFQLRRNNLTDSPMILANAFNNTPGFYHGVASGISLILLMTLFPCIFLVNFEPSQICLCSFFEGDPLSDSIILWTRYTPVLQNEVVTIELRMAPLNLSIAFQDLLNPEKNPQLRRATINITEASDFIAKIEVVGLESMTKYVYSFSGK